MHSLKHHISHPSTNSKQYFIMQYPAEPHKRQVNAIHELLRQLHLYATVQQQADLPILNDIVNRIHQLCHFSNLNNKINNKIFKIYRTVLMALCDCMHIPWVLLQLSLNRILSNLILSMNEIIRLAQQHHDNIMRQVRIEEEKRKKQAMRSIKWPTVQIQYISKSESNKSNEEDVCGVCLDIHKKKDCLTCSCNHIFGKKCLKGWFETCKRNLKGLNCPTCRQNVQNLIEFKVEINT